MWDLRGHLSTANKAQISMEDDKPLAKGVIGTPFDVKPFQVSLSDPPKEPGEAHYTWECSTTYPKEEENISKNPITGMNLAKPIANRS